jgi:hypothetical protein
MKPTPIVFGCFIFVAIGVVSSASNSCPTATCALRNLYLRFGSGTENSVNQFAFLQQPFYYSAPSWYKVTASSYPLDMAIGTGTGSTHWTGATVVDLYSLSTPTVSVNYSAFKATSTTGGVTEGYGTITAEFQATINNQLITISNSFTLGLGSRVASVTTTLTNPGVTVIDNVRLWAGTRDNFIRNNDVSKVAHGTSNAGVFTLLPNRNVASSSIRISDNTDTDVIYWYSFYTSMNTVSASTNFINSIDTNPASSEISTTTPSTATRSYALTFNVGSLQPGESKNVQWFLQGIGSSTMSTEIPTAFPTNAPTASPSGAPSADPTAFPTNAPTASPSGAPSADPTASPSNEPTASPSDAPSAEPTASPSNEPTASPSDAPSAEPTATPSNEPTASPSDAPSAEPTVTPSNEPTASPSDAPSAEPTASPTEMPTMSPTRGVLGSWCVHIGLFDSFGDGWGEGAALRIYDKNDPLSYLVVSNTDRSFFEETVCLNPSRLLYAQVVCYNCDLHEPWEMYYTVTETRGKDRKSFIGAYDTVMAFKGRETYIKYHPIDFKDKRHACKDQCRNDRHYHYSDKVIDTTGKGKKFLMIRTHNVTLYLVLCYVGIRLVHKQSYGHQSTRV